MKPSDPGTAGDMQSFALGAQAPPWSTLPPALPAGALPGVSEEERVVLDDDWQDLSVMAEADDATASIASGAWTLAGEVVDSAIIVEDLLGAALSSSDEEHSHILDLDETEHPELSMGWDASNFGCAVPALSDSNSDAVDTLVFTWGDNSAGQCLVGDTRPHLWQPERIEPKCIPTSACCGNRCTVLVSQQGDLWGGGLNTPGLLAAAAPDTPLRTPTHVDLAELESLQLASAAASHDHILAVTSTGSLVAWASSNQHGQAGVGAEHCMESPVFPQTLSWPPRLHAHPLVATAVACGDEHSLVLTDHGEVYVFGSNAVGQLGLGSSVKSAATPTAVGGKARGVPFRAIAAGAKHSLSMTLAGGLYSWGDNTHGALGLGSSWSSHSTMDTPMPVQGLLGPARRVAAGGNHSAVIARKGRLVLAGDNSCGQLGHRRWELAVSYDFIELPMPFRTELCVRAVALGHEHSLLLTYHGHLYAFGKNSEGQCGCGIPPGSSQDAVIEVPVEVPLPCPRLSAERQLVVWAIATGHSHNIALCSTLPAVQASSPFLRRLSAGETLYGTRGRPLSGHDRNRGRSQQRRMTQVLAVGRRRSLRSVHSLKSDRTPGPSPSPTQRSSTHDESAMAAAMSWAPGGARNWFKDILDADLEERRGAAGFDQTQVSEAPAHLPNFRFLRPIVHPGTSLQPFSALSVQVVAALAESELGDSLRESELGRVLLNGLATPSVLNASFCYPGLRSSRLDSAGLCRGMAALCGQGNSIGQQLLDAAAEGLHALARGHVEDLTHRDQLRAVAVYLMLPANRHAQGTGSRRRPLLASIAHLVARMSGVGRTALRDLLADECGDVRVLRDFLVPNVRALAEDTIRALGQQQWLAGQLWEVVAQLQLQRPLWEAVLLLQVLASASEQAARLLEVDVRGEEAAAAISASGSGSLAAQFVSASLSVPVGGRANIGLVDSSVFQLTALAEGCIPPEVDFWLFQEHALFHQITPSEVVQEPWWCDAAGMLPRRFCSFMSHANLVPTTFKQRVLQVENVLRQRLSQEQVMWPRVESVLGGGRADLSQLYFILSVSRQNLLRDTFAQMYFASPVDLRRPLRVEFTGEEAVDEGGVMREFFRLLVSELFAPDAGLFYEVEGSRRLWFCPILGAGRQLEDYWMVGVIVALAVYNNHPGLDLPLPSALFKKLKEQPTSPEDLAQLFPSHARSLEAIRAWVPSQEVTSDAGADKADKEFMDTFGLSFCWSGPSMDGGVLKRFRCVRTEPVGQCCTETERSLWA